MATMAVRWNELTYKAKEAVQSADYLASRHGNPEVLPLHLLAVLLARPRTQHGSKRIWWQPEVTPFQNGWQDGLTVLHEHLGHARLW